MSDTFDSVFYSRELLVVSYVKTFRYILWWGRELSWHKC